MPPAANLEALFVPDGIHPVLYYGGAIVMDTATGRYEALNQTASELLTTANETGSRDAVHDRFLAKYPDVSSDKVISAVDINLETIIGRGVLAVGDSRPPRQFAVIEHESQPLARYGSAVEMVRAAEEKVSLNLSERALGIRSLIQTVRLMRQPSSRWISGLGQMMTSDLADASFEQALHCKGVIASVSSKWPGRVACLEAAVATVLFGRARDLRINLQFGVALDPIRFHAWPEAPHDGRPVTLPNEERIPGVFHPIYKLQH